MVCYEQKIKAPSGKLSLRKWFVILYIFVNLGTQELINYQFADKKLFSLICNHHHTLWLLTCFKEMCFCVTKFLWPFFLSFSPLTTIKICCFQATASLICKTLFLLVILTSISYTYTHIYFLHVEKPLQK